MVDPALVERSIAREEDALDKEYECGGMTQKEYDDRLRDIRHAYRDAYEEACDEALELIAMEWGY